MGDRKLSEIQTDVELYRTLVETSKELICLHEPNGVYIYLNPALNFLTGYLEDELIGRDFYDFIHPDDRERILEVSQIPVLLRNQPVPMEYRFRRKDGTYVWFQTLMQLILEEDGTVKNLHSTSRDISSRIELTRRLQQERKFSSLMSELAHVGAWEWYPTENSVFWSSEVFRIHERNELLGVNANIALQYTILQDRALVRRCFILAKEEGRSFSIEHRIKTESGKIRWVRTQGRPTTTVEGRVATVYGAIQDITLSKSVEEEIRLSERKFFQAFHSSGIGMALTNPEGATIEVNYSLAELLGYSKDELLKRNILEITFPEDLAEITANMEKLVRGEKESYQTVQRYVHKNGAIIWALLTVVLVRKNSGQPMFFVSQMQDITRRRNLENILREKNSRLKSISVHLQERIEQLEEFNQIVSHNMRSPIGNISTLVKFLEDAVDEEEKLEYLGYLKQTADQLLITLNDLVEVIKIRQTRKVAKEKIIVEEAFSKVRAMFQAQILEYNAEVIVDFKEAPEIRYSRVYLESILLNLFSNSLKYRDPSKSPILKYSTYWKNNAFVLEAADNGLGIDLDKYGNQIFKLNKTFHRDIDGKGIGLFMTKNQIESMGGEIYVESQPGIGTKFLIHLTKENEFVE
ncbi:PAS domain-containing sensor histidine kinase [Leptospira perolatii]|uniref:histidine kinase n=1 Tax=Leptospira perolatii TaxID=2023191 RepID=A0A2M9ZRY1_9LEPT|nr:PAS domain-containing sensor histidine kinase [Leptospira perolatii]PJZ71198.1 PAS domain-containing sensor histidine kinase [Leptospira perolatii]PJZ74731.1 PAS domain-containing sensor histidine kinase [Leptospira perolatii]